MPTTMLASQILGRCQYKHGESAFSDIIVVRGLAANYLAQSSGLLMDAASPKAPVNVDYWPSVSMNSSGYRILPNERHHI